MGECCFWSRRGDSNARPPRPERGALPTALLLVFSLRRKNLGIAWNFVIFWVVKQGTPPSFTSENNLIPSQILDLDEHFTNSRSRQRT